MPIIRERAKKKKKLRKELKKNIKGLNIFALRTDSSVSGNGLRNLSD